MDQNEAYKITSEVRSAVENYILTRFPADAAPVAWKKEAVDTAMHLLSKEGWHGETDVDLLRWMAIELLRKDLINRDGATGVPGSSSGFGRMPHLVNQL